MMVRVVKDYIHREQEKLSCTDHCQEISDNNVARILPYLETRIYDAIASFFSFIRPCVAIHSVDKRMSYNTSFAELSLPLADDEKIDVIGKKHAKPGDKKFSLSSGIIFTTLKNCLLQDSKDILKLYLLFNTEFINFTTNYLLKGLSNSNEDIKIENKAKAFNCNRTEARHLFIDQHLELLRKGLKYKMQRLTQEERKLQSEGRELHEKGLTKANNDKFEKCNEKREEIKVLVKELQELSDLNPQVKKIESELKILIQHKRSARKEDKNEIQLKVDKKKAELNDLKGHMLAEEKIELDDLQYDFSFLSESNFFIELKETYIQLIEMIKDGKGVLLPDKELRGEMLRPLQDTVKIKYILNEEEISSLVGKITVIKNPQGKHTEYNIFTEEGNHAKKEDYIGVSKLCCGYCHKELGHDQHNHRGTHGVLDKRWNPQERRRSIDKELEELVIELKTAPHQHRRLSFDDCEKEISLKDILGLEEEISLFTYKADCELLSGNVDTM